jgi:hypothetical protein
MEMTKTVMIEEAELQHLIKEIDNFKRAIIELEKRKEELEYIECVCPNILVRLNRMRDFLTFLT